MITIVKLICAILFPILNGWIFVSLLRPKKESLSNLENLALAFLIGNGILSLEIFLLGACRIKLTAPNILLGSALILAAPLYFSLKHKTLAFNVKSWVKIDRWKWPELLLLALILLRVSFVFFENLIKPVIGVDAFANWSFRAKVFFVESGLPLDPNSGNFLGGGAIFYPLNMPLQETWIFTVLGAWNDELVKIIFGLFFISLLVIFYGALRRLAPRSIALLATYLLTTLPLLTYHSTIEYADFPLSVYFTASVLFLLHYLHSADRKYLIISALLAGIGTWTKTEGLPLLLINLIVLSVYYVKSRKEILYSIRNVLGYFLVALIFKAPWSIFNLAYHIPKSIYQRIEYENILVNLPRIPVIINQFYSKMFFYGNWNIAWFVFVVILLLSWRQLKDPRRLFSLAYIIILLLMFFVMYFLTENYAWLLDGTTLNRNFLVIMPLVVYFIAINLQVLFDNPGAAQSGRR